MSEADLSTSTLRRRAVAWRRLNPEHKAGVVLLWKGRVYGWKNKLRDAHQERPGAIAIDDEGHVFIAEGGSYEEGAKCWVAASDV